MKDGSPFIPHSAFSVRRVGVSVRGTQEGSVLSVPLTMIVFSGEK